MAKTFFSRGSAAGLILGISRLNVWPRRCKRPGRFFIKGLLTGHNTPYAIERSKDTFGPCASAAYQNAPKAVVRRGTMVYS